MPVVSGATTPSFGPLEVFHKDHRNQNGKWKCANDLLRYTITEGSGSPLLEVWNPASGGAWAKIGNYQLQASNTGPVLPVQSVQFQTISPEEIIWVERRYDTAGTALVVVTNRVRRGSRLIESQIVAASGAGLTGSLSIAILSVVGGAWAGSTSADGTGVAFTAAGFSQVPGFTFLTAPAFPANWAGASLYAGATVPAGTITRLGLLAGLQDAQYTALGATAALYAARWASYNRQRIKQKILVSLSA